MKNLKRKNDERKRILFPSHYELMMDRLDRKYFSEFRFEDRRIAKKLTAVFVCDNKTGKKTLRYGDMPFYFSEIGLSNWRIKLGRFKKGDGQCCSKSKTIKLLNSLKGEELKNVLLHEMIHAYEFIKGPCYEFYRQYIFYHLIKKLEKELGEKKLARMINLHMHSELIIHSVLFLLKSLDLDIKLKLSLGSICGYSREKYFNSID